MAIKFREETTDWGNQKVHNNIYITEGRTLIGYIPRGETTPRYFSSPKRLWSTTGRKFRDLSAKEVKQYV